MPFWPYVLLCSIAPMMPSASSALNCSLDGLQLFHTPNCGGAVHFFAWLGQAQPLLETALSAARSRVVAGLAPAMLASLRSMQKNEPHPNCGMWVVMQINIIYTEEKRMHIISYPDSF